MRPAAVLVAMTLSLRLARHHLRMLRAHWPQLRAAYGVDNPARPWWTP